MQIFRILVTDWNALLKTLSVEFTKRLNWRWFGTTVYFSHLRLNSFFFFCPIIYIKFSFQGLQGTQTSRGFSPGSLGVEWISRRDAALKKQNLKLFNILFNFSIAEVTKARTPAGSASQGCCNHDQLSWGAVVITSGRSSILWKFKGLALG